MSEKPVNQAALDAVDFAVNEYNKGGVEDGPVVARHIDAIDEQGNRTHVSIDDMLLTRGYGPDKYNEHAKEFPEDRAEHLARIEAEKQGIQVEPTPVASTEVTPPNTEKPYDWEVDSDMSTKPEPTTPLGGEVPSSQSESDYKKRQADIDRIIANRGVGEGDRRAAVEASPEKKEIESGPQQKMDAVILEILTSQKGHEWHKDEELMQKFLDGFHDFANANDWDAMTRLRQLIDYIDTIDAAMEKRPIPTTVDQGTTGGEGGPGQTPEKAEAIAGLNQELNDLFEELKNAPSEEEIVRLKERLKDVTKKLFALEGKSDEDTKKALKSIDEFKVNPNKELTSKEIEALSEEKIKQFGEAINQQDLEKANLLKAEILQLARDYAKASGFDDQVTDQYVAQVESLLNDMLPMGSIELNPVSEPTEATRKKTLRMRLASIPIKIMGRVGEAFSRNGERMSKRRKVAYALGAAATVGVVWLNAKGYIDINPFDGDGLDLNPFNNDPLQGGSGSVIGGEGSGSGTGGSGGVESPAEIQPVGGINPETGDLYRSDILMTVYDGKGAAQQFEMNNLVPQGYGQQLAELLHDRGLDNGAHIPGFKDGGMWHTADGKSPWSLEAKQALADFKAWMKI